MPRLKDLVPVTATVHARATRHGLFRAAWAAAEGGGRVSRVHFASRVARCAVGGDETAAALPASAHAHGAQTARCVEALRRWVDAREAARHAAADGRTDDDDDKDDDGAYGGRRAPPHAAVTASCAERGCSRGRAASALWDEEEMRRALETDEALDDVLVAMLGALPGGLGDEVGSRVTTCAQFLPE